MVNSADELLALSQSGQEEWFQSHLKEQFLQSLMDCPVVAMNVQIDDEFNGRGHAYLNVDLIKPL